jgi:hypothetical protein
MGKSLTLYGLSRALGRSFAQIQKESRRAGFPRPRMASGKATYDLAAVRAWRRGNIHLRRGDAPAATAVLSEGQFSAMLMQRELTNPAATPTAGGGFLGWFKSRFQLPAGDSLAAIVSTDAVSRMEQLAGLLLFALLVGLGDAINPDGDAPREDAPADLYDDAMDRADPASMGRHLHDAIDAWTRNEW